MPKTTKVKLTLTQLGTASAMIDFWEQDPKLCGLIKIVETPLAEVELNSEVTYLETYGIPYDLWKEFCEKVGIQEPFPGY